MKDPLAPDGQDPYCLFALPSASTASAAEAAMDAYNQRNPGREMEATEAWDALRDPVTRLAVDVFRYNPADQRNDLTSYCHSLVSDLIGRLASTMQTLAGELDFGADKAMVDVPECEQHRESTR